MGITSPIFKESIVPGALCFVKTGNWGYIPGGTWKPVLARHKDRYLVFTCVEAEEGPQGQEGKVLVFHGTEVGLQGMTICYIFYEELEERNSNSKHTEVVKTWKC